MATKRKREVKNSRHDLLSSKLHSRKRYKSKGQSHHFRSHKLAVKRDEMASHTTAKNDMSHTAALRAELEASEEAIQYWKHKYLELEEKSTQVSANAHRKYPTDGAKDPDAIEHRQEVLLRLVATQLNITSLVSMWIENYKTKLLDNYHIPIHISYDATDLVPFEKVSKDWYQKAELVRLLSVLSICAYHSGHTLHANDMYTLAINTKATVPRKRHPHLVCGIIALYQYCLTTGNFETAIALHKEAGEIVNTILKGCLQDKNVSNVMRKYIHGLTTTMKKFTPCFFYDRSQELADVKQQWIDIHYVFSKTNPTFQEAVLAIWIVCYKIWLSISTTSPSFISENRSIPTNVFTKLTTDVLTENLRQLEKIRQFADLSLSKTHVLIRQKWDIVLKFVSALVHYSRGEKSETLRLCKQVVEQLTDEVTKLLTLSISLFILLDIGIIAIKSNDGNLFTKVAILLFAKYDITRFPFLKALFNLADESGISFSKEYIVNAMFNYKPKECSHT